MCSRGTALAPFPVCATEMSSYPVHQDFGKHVLPIIGGYLNVAYEVHVLLLFRAAAR